jgi:rhodanese-related sulfurtransferase
MLYVKRTLSFLLMTLLPLMAQAADAYRSPTLTPLELESRLGTPEAPLVVDLRSPAEFGVGHVPGAINIPLPELEKRLDEIRSDNGVLVYCINGSRTRQAEPILFMHDFDDVYHLEGAFYAWIQGKHPIEKGGIKKKSRW